MLALGSAPQGGMMCRRTRNEFGNWENLIVDMLGLILVLSSLLVRSVF